MGGVTTPECWLSDAFPAHVSDPEEELDVKLGGGRGAPLASLCLCTSIGASLGLLVHQS